jgi:hypothetical protein
MRNDTLGARPQKVRAGCRRKGAGSSTTRATAKMGPRYHYFVTRLSCRVVLSATDAGLEQRRVVGAPDEPPASLAVRVSAAMGFNIEL